MEKMVGVKLVKQLLSNTYAVHAIKMMLLR